MRIRELLPTSVVYLRPRILLSSLTILGMVAGVSLTVVLGSFVDEFKAGIYSHQFESLANSFSITKAQPHATRASGVQSLSDSDVRALELNLNPALVSHVIPITSGAAVLKYQDNTFHGGLIGGPADYLTYMRTPLVAGSMFTPRQAQDNARVVLVGPAVVSALFHGDTSAALGSSISIGRLRFQVVGLLGKDATGGNAAVSVVPISTARNSLLGGIRTVSTIGMVTTEAGAVPAAIAQATTILEQQHTPKKSGLEDDFTMTTFQSAQPAVAEQLLLATLWFALGVTALALLLGCIGLSVIMLRAVTEHSREIAIRRAVGAYRRNILRKFLTESTFIAVMCGLLGVSLGVAVARIAQSILAHVAPQFGTFRLPLEPAVAIALGISVFLGVVAGLLPAVRAARLHVPDTLHR